MATLSTHMRCSVRHTTSEFQGSKSNHARVFSSVYSEGGNKYFMKNLLDLQAEMGQREQNQYSNWNRKQNAGLCGSGKGA